ncbi:Myc-type basic helix-loop-helix (bHLH) domain [Arabidopsis thaliana x Arabidopsis arenosa]|uniref:Myc-type basic helix-loop-helix (BHLH) domain n=1 Tax=Arabidopsis thaliana x Arabidopsis arenosa TaxID=1240361 RepID=A0A8T2AVN7_9BRAS|nr:Myc-type basic helix-loop-helix (bHLH) domain [Arabidopsis thaliana x Arabidopsis arenosa]
METEFDSLTELPPLPPSDFTPSSFTFSDHHLDLSLSHADSLFLDSTLSLLNRHHVTESTRLEHLFYDSTHLFHNDVSTINTTPFLHLPELKSIEQPPAAEEEPTTMKLFPSLSPPSLPAAKRRKRRNSSSSSTTSGSPPASSSNTNDGGTGITKRKKISDKIRSLEKLMPWENKMSLAMILEESHRYIKFLQSQIASLSWMPLESVYNTAGEVGESDLLKSLTRQQILQVLVNSPGSRNVLSSRGVCLFSYEQLLSLKTMSRNL